MDIDLEALTLAALLTTTGAAALATIITGFVGLLKSLVPAIDAGREPQAVAITAAIVVLLLAVQAVSTGAMVVGVPLLLAVLFGWYGVTRLSMSIHDDIRREPRSLTNQTS